MKNKLITITALTFLPFLLIAQENNAILCSDGIDNDNDGLVDCEDPGCINLSDDGCSLCGDGSSFADVVFEYSSGCPFSDPLPQGALGVADYNFEPGDNPTFVFLGEGGFIKLGFTNNVLSNSGDNQDDLWVFEIGAIVESIDIALRPLDNFTETQLQNSGISDANSDGYYEVGTLGGATSSFDIDLAIPGYTAGELKFDAIEIKDVLDGDCSTATSGADIDAVCALFSIPSDCAGVPNGTAVIDDCGECLEPNDPNFNQSCADCAGVPNGAAVFDDCGECLEPNDPNFNQSCADCDGVPNGTAVIDDCGECLEPDDPDFNESCVDCDGVPNGTAIIDDCGECLEPNDPNFNQSCVDCAGVPNGLAVIDDCGQCLEPIDPDFNQSCADCAGIPNGSAVIDDCGECLEPNDPNFNQLCIDCAGVFNGTSIVDDCGECLEPDDPNFNQSCSDCAGVPNGMAVIDDCGECNVPTGSSFNQSCSDCAGVPYGTAVIDDCGECLEPNDPNFNRSCIGEKNIYIPNAFTPDGDGLNEVFQVEGIGIQKVKLWIFNRFGEQIYYTEGVSVSWDGRGGQGSNHFAPNGVYAYRVKVHVEDAEVQELKGFVSLIR
ncbi:T9SS type B sorting domain-containing protein [Halocola ammonii]